MVGFTTTEDFTGKKQFAFVVEQPYVTGRFLDYSKEADQFRNEIKKVGFNVELENFKPKLFNDSYIVRDLHAENVLFTNKGSYLFIDTVPVLNTDDGQRHYGDGLLALRDSDTQNVSKRVDENEGPLVQYVYPPASVNI